MNNDINNMDEYYRQKYLERLQREKEEAIFQEQMNKEWRSYQGEEAKKEGKEKKKIEKEQKKMENAHAEALEMDKEWEAQREAERQAKIKEEKRIEAERIKADEEAEKRAIKEAEERAAREAEEQAAQHAARQLELESVFIPEQEAINDGEKIIKQVHEAPQKKPLSNNVEDILKDRYNSLNTPEGRSAANLIDGYNKHGFSVKDIDEMHKEALDMNKAMDDEALVRSYLEWDDKSRGKVDADIKNFDSVDDVKIEYNRWADNAKLKSTTNEVQDAVNKAINSTKTKEEAIEFIENNFKGDTKYGARRIVDDSYSYVYESIHANKIARSATDNTAEQIAKNAKKSALKNIGHMFNVGFAVVDYKDARESGKSVAGSLGRAGMEFVKGEVLGGWVYAGSMLAKAAPNLAVTAIEGVNSMSRSMNSYQRKQLFGDAEFMDTPQLATMRQSGMELAKMSQYNLQQTLMGSEAEHLHKL